MLDVFVCEEELNHLIHWFRPTTGVKTLCVLETVICPFIHSAAIQDISLLRSHLRLDHGQTVRTHLRHHPQDICELVLSDVLHQPIQSDERPRPADSGAEPQTHKQTDVRQETDGGRQTRRSRIETLHHPTNSILMALTVRM